MPDAPAILRVFLSSTAMDMKACRQKVSETLLELRHLPVGMESFGALPGFPAEECRKLVAECDLVVAMVAHRYGYVPSVERGGDGKRSITWLEVQAAKDAGKPVLAFLIEPKAPWDQAKENERFEAEPEEKHAEILKAVQGLKEFKAYLQGDFTPKFFTSADDLATKVTTTLTARVTTRTDSHAVRPPKVWRPLVCYPLQPAPHFQGREALRSQLLAWAKAAVTPDRVVSLVALGGTGKTALAQRVLAELGEEIRAGVLVWSFYENPRTEEFLATACEYFTGERPTSVGGILERLQRALAGDVSHLLVLDGFERVQAEGTTGRPRGELEDPQLRRLLRWLAAGQGTRTRALVTSRFPLLDLADWKGAGHREERLEDLEPDAAWAVLRGWGVRGDDSVLDGLARPLHYHALSVAVLGSYLGKLWGGDATKAPTFDRGEQSAADPKAARLTRILTHYAEKLPGDQRDLLARLSTFPRGVTVEFLGFLVDAGGQIAGALVGYNQVRLLGSLEQLRELGLVFRYATAAGATFTAHPFLRDYFGALLGVTRPEQIHEAVRVRLAPGLEARPKKKPTEVAELDRYEALIEHTRLAGRTKEAFNLYWFGLGNFSHLAKILADYARGLRILSPFVPGGQPDAVTAELPDRDRSALINDLGLYAGSLGDLATARRAFASAADIDRRTDDWKSLCVDLRNRAENELRAGWLPEAREAAAVALIEAEKAGDRIQTEVSHAYLAAALTRLGHVDDGRQHFAAATELEDKPQLYSKRGVLEAEFKRAAGEAAAAKDQTRANLAIVGRANQTTDQALCETLLGLLSLPGDVAAARQHLQDARAFAARSGHVDVQLRSYHLASELARAERDFDRARGEAEAGIQFADSCGYGLYAIELRLALSRALLDAGDPKSALQRAREALDRSVHPECQYAWGEADGLHLCGVAHARLGERELAGQRLTAALAKREQLTHPGLPETRAELARLGG